MKIFIADDHQVVRDGVKLILENAFEGTEISEAGSFSELLSIVESDNQDDLILCDLKMQDYSGIEGIRAIRDAYPNIKLVIFSGSFSPDDINDVLAIGVNGFVAKRSSGTSLVNIIKLVLAGETYLPSELLDCLSTKVEQDKPLQLKSLTNREKEVLKYLSSGLSNKEIARKLFIEESTIKSHIKNIYEKLGVSNRTKAAKFASNLVE